MTPLAADPLHLLTALRKKQTNRKPEGKTVQMFWCLMSNYVCMMNVSKLPKSLILNTTLSNIIKHIWFTYNEHIYIDKNALPAKMDLPPSWTRVSVSVLHFISMKNKGDNQTK